MKSEASETQRDRFSENTVANVSRIRQNRSSEARLQMMKMVVAVAVAVTAMLICCTTPARATEACSLACEEQGYTGADLDTCLFACMEAASTSLSTNCTIFCNTSLGNACVEGCTLGRCMSSDDPACSSSSSTDTDTWVIIGVALLAFGGLLCIFAVAYAVRVLSTASRDNDLADAEHSAGNRSKPKGAQGMEWDGADTLASIDKPRRSSALRCQLGELGSAGSKPSSQSSLYTELVPMGSQPLTDTSSGTRREIQYLTLSHMPQQQPAVRGSYLTTKTEYAEIDHVRTSALAAAITESNHTNRYPAHSTTESHAQRPVHAPGHSSRSNSFSSSIA